MPSAEENTESGRLNGEISPPSPVDVLLQSSEMNGGHEEEESPQLLSAGDGDSGVASAEERQPDDLMLTEEIGKPLTFDAEGMSY